MKKIISILLSIICVIALVGCSSNPPQNTLPSEPPVNTAEPSHTPTESDIQEQSKQPEEGDSMPTVNIQVGNSNFTIIMHDNESARAIIEEMPFTLNMDDYAAQEKVTGLTFDLPSAQTQVPSTINAGEIYLWSGNHLVLFYTTFSNSYSYVPIGYIEDVTGLQDALGRGNITITFSTQ